MSQNLQLVMLKKKKRKKMNRTKIEKIVKELVAASPDMTKKEKAIYLRSLKDFDLPQLLEITALLKKQQKENIRFLKRVENKYLQVLQELMNDTEQL